MPTTATDPKEETDQAYDELEDVLNENPDLRQPVETKHPTVALDPGTRIIECTDLPVIRRGVVVRPEMKEWVRQRAEARDESYSNFVRRVLMWQTNKVLTQGEERPENFNTDPGARSAHITITIKPTHVTLAQMAAERWDTGLAPFGAHALRRYRQRVEEVG